MTSHALYRKLIDSNELTLIVWAIPVAGSQERLVNYWMQKCDPTLMGVEWDNQEANDDWKFVRAALKSFVFSFRCLTCIHYLKLYWGLFMHWLTILYSFRVHECIQTQRACSRLTAVHEASAGLTALVWLHTACTLVLLSLCGPSLT